jgi:hypothetical protein
MGENQKNKNCETKWNPELAYAVGLITTDGNLSPDGRHMMLASNDVPLLKTFKKCLKLKNKIGVRKSGYTKIKNCYRVQFGDVVLYKWLLNIGLMPNKTKTIGALKIPNQYFFDFLRGHLDGDGCICRYQDPVYLNSQRLYIKFYSASIRHIEWVQKKIKCLIKISGFIRCERREFSLTFAKKDSLTLSNYLYYINNIPCLKRKFKIVKDFLKISPGGETGKHASFRS